MGMGLVTNISATGAFLETQAALRLSKSAVSVSPRSNHCAARSHWKRISAESR